MPSLANRIRQWFSRAQEQVKVEIVAARELLKPQAEPETAPTPQPKQTWRGPRPKVTMAGLVGGLPGVIEVEAPLPHPRCMCSAPLRQRCSAFAGYRCGQCGGVVA
jgi:hypothetical protein